MKNNANLKNKIINNLKLELQNARDNNVGYFEIIGLFFKVFPEFRTKLNLHTEKIIQAKEKNINEKDTEQYQSYLELSLQEELLKFKESQLRFKALFDSLVELIWFKNIDGVFVTVNKAFLEVCNKVENEVIGFKDADIWPEEIAKKYIIGDEDVIRTKKSKTFEEMIWNDSSNEKWIETVKTPVLNEIGEVVGTVGIARDITLRKEAENLFKLAHNELELLIEERTIELAEAKLESEKARKEAERVNKLKSVFLANMSHEIRTPMNAIIGFADVLYKTKLDENQSEVLGHIKTSGQALLSLINDILDFSKIEAGKLEIECVEFDLNKIVWEVIGMVHFFAKEKGVEVRLDYDSRIQNKLLLDPGRMRQVLLNLVNNAIKFTSAGYVELKVMVIEETEEKIKIEMSVTDTGIGISEKYKSIIFEPFMQADGSITRNYGGTGLGLAISNNLVKLMGAQKINVESEQGKGSKFYFEISFVKCDKLESYPDNGYDFKGEEIKPKIKMHYKVLVAEDNNANKVLISKVLKMNEHSYTIVENGEQALNLITSGEYFDVVLMDVQMPVMDGYEATEKLRKAGFDLPIIAMTAGALKGDREECLNKGMDDYISKPIDINEFENVLDKVIRLKKNNNYKNHKKLRAEINCESDFKKNIAKLSGECAKKVFDYDRVIKNSGNIEEIIFEMVSLFIKYWDSYFNDIKEAGRLEKIDKLKKSAHKLKGTALQAGAAKIGDILYTLEMLHDEDKIDSHILEMIKLAEFEFAEYRKELSNYPQFREVLNDYDSKK